MGDHFVLLVDRLITESTLEAAIQSQSRSIQATMSAFDEKPVECSGHEACFEDLPYPRKIVECRICHDEDEDSKMESPCSCCGSLKYAHRRCVQRWCNEKGDITCEICHQQFKPGYTAPPPLFQLGQIPLNFRGNWGISRRDLMDPSFITVVQPDHDFLNHGYEEYPVSSSRSMICCRSVAIIVKSLESSLAFSNSNSKFMILLILRHTLPILLNGTNEYAFPLITLLLLRTAGVILPIYAIAKVASACQRRRSQQEDEETSDSSSSDEETETRPSSRSVT